MTLERWQTTRQFVASSLPGADLDELERLQPVFVEIADTGSADSLNTIRHGLGRIPRGATIINSAVAASGDCSWHRLTTDAAWTATEINMRFRPANRRVLLRIE